MSADKSLYRVWPDGWVQDASEEPYSWRSDDFLVIAAEDEDAALAEALRLARHLARYLERDYGTHITPSEAARELRRLYAENATLQQVYDATQLEIDQLRGVTQSKLLAQPVAWMVYLPSIDTQHLYYSQEDMGYVDDVTNHADAEVTPLYEMAAPKVEVAPAGEYPPLPDPKFARVVDGIPCITLLEHGLLMRAYVDADRAMRAQAAPENIRSILVRCRDFIDTTKVPAYPAGADLADEIDMVLAAQSITQPAPVREEEREAFKAAHRHLELDEVPDAWGRPTFKHSHIEASWLGWIARAARKQGVSHDNT